MCIGFFNHELRKITYGRIVDMMYIVQSGPVECVFYFDLVHTAEMWTFQKNRLKGQCRAEPACLKWGDHRQVFLFSVSVLFASFFPTFIVNYIYIEICFRSPFFLFLFWYHQLSFQCTFTTSYLTLMPAAGVGPSPGNTDTAQQWLKQRHWLSQVLPQMFVLAKQRSKPPSGGLNYLKPTW